MKVIRLKNVSVPDIPNNTPEYLSRKVPKKAFPLHLLCACVGGRGTGKSTLALKLINWYLTTKSFDRIILFSTTAHKDAKMKHFISECEKSEDLDIVHYQHFSPTDLQYEMDRMDTDIKEYRKYLKYLEVWKKFKKVKSVDEMTLDELVLLEEMDFRKPESDFKHGFPCFLIVFDDCVGERVFNANMTGVGNRLLISHRHYSCSVMILSQTFTNFIPKQIRNNNIGLWMLAGTKCEKTMKEIADDVSSKVSPQMFMKAWKYATKDKFHFFLCDYDTPDDDWRFRQDLDKLIVFNESDEVSADEA